MTVTATILTGRREQAVVVPDDALIGSSDGSDRAEVLRVRGGRASTLEVSIGGSGDVNFGGTAGDVSAAIAGSGDVRVAQATGAVSRSIVGSGDLRIGR